MIFPWNFCELLRRLQPDLSNLSVMSASAASDPLYHAANSLQVMIVQRLAAAWISSWKETACVSLWKKIYVGTCLQECDLYVLRSSTYKIVLMFLHFYIESCWPTSVSYVLFCLLFCSALLFCSVYCRRSRECRRSCHWKRIFKTGMTKILFRQVNSVQSRSR